MPLECIRGVTLLSVEEAENLLTQWERICIYKEYPYWWWLRSPGSSEDYAAYVGTDGTIYRSGVRTDFDNNCVRPVLILSDIGSSNLQIGDIFEFGDNNFKIISSKYALCERAIEKCAFRKDSGERGANVYEKSDVKKIVDKWFACGMQDEMWINDRTNSTLKTENGIDWGFD